MQAAASFVKYGKKIVAIGRNYADHAKELGNQVPKEPFFFLKPTTSYVQSGGRVEIPRGVIAHHEVELGVVIGKDGRDITEQDADSHVAGYALAVDMTARNLQEDVKKKGLPWSAAKGFDTFTPIGPFIPSSQVADPYNLRISLKIKKEAEGKVVVPQDGNTKDMIFHIPRLIEHISSIMTLEAGDVILTGTPPGVGPIVSGDLVECTLAETSPDGSTGKTLSTLNFTVVNRETGYNYQGGA
ncbi:hypothetical protein PILCRDRAFT_98056 [Piloderma croceum F 1598]|uniref:Fumarylacetoacetase-like C-terminal domain-containing protein n=1 Tax=Piloderma croceum (strain F 1598) TaxID=765440 RepID=A0A0C3F504_PILCF|nr:hypothetical protein PILCRDRAFT_98056 [Piloderma croceum F 1598]